MAEQWVELQEGTWLYCWSWRCWLQTSRTHWVRLRDQDLEDIGGSVMLSHLLPSLLYECGALTLLWGTLKTNL